VSAEVTLPALLRRNALTMPRRTAMREKRRGIWRPLTWRDYWQAVHDFASGLAAIGFRRGDKLSVIGDNRPRLYMAQIAAQCLGGIAVPVYQDSIAAELVFVLEHAEVAVVVAEDQEQVDKILSLRDRLPRLRLLVYDNPLGLAQYNVPFLRAFDEIDEEGRKFADAHPGYVEAELGKGTPDDIALLVYTSGTTGRSKGVMLSHANLIASGEALAASEDIRASEEWLCYLPMAWVGDALYSTVMSLLVGFTCNCPESPRTLLRDLRELGPTAFLGPPRIWENLLTSVQVKAADATPLKRKIFEIFRDLAARAELRRSDGRPVPGISGGRRACLWPGTRPAGARACALGLHRWRAARPRCLPLLSVVRHQSEADLWRNGAVRRDIRAARQRSRSQYGRPNVPWYRRADCVQRRGARSFAGRVSRLL
jgi:long-chain acyl-CoA synthetase